MDEVKDNIEEWRPVPGWNGLYEASNFGHIRRLHKETKPRHLKPKIGPTGYLIVVLYSEGIRTQIFVHRVIASTFVGIRPDGYQVNHKDGRKANNMPSNLEYVTAAENTRHAHRMGLATTPKGTNHPNAKIDDDIVRLIRTSPMEGKELAAILGIATSTFSLIRTGKRWRHVK